MSGRPQDLITDQTLTTFDGDPRLLREALLRRGLLVRGNRLAEGTRPEERRALETIPGLVVRPDGEVELAPGADVRGVARAILMLAEHHDGESMGAFTGVGPAPRVGRTWASYRRTVWGAKLPVTRARRSGQRVAEGSLDIGVALLVRTAALARATTSSSCDGHGVRPAFVSFHYPWDVVWHELVVRGLGVPTPRSRWTWTETEVRIEPVDGWGDQSLLGMLLDIHEVARAFLDESVVAWTGAARARLLAHFGAAEPTMEEFATIAAEVLGSRREA